MFDQKNCKDLDNLPYYYAWNRHCGGSPGQFLTRTISLTDAAILGYASSRLLLVSRRFGSTLGLGLFTKSMNDLYEAWTGDNGVVRDALGDSIYDTIGYATTIYGLTRKVPKINYLGNPKHDFFIKDPISYESAFRQYSRLEVAHFGISTGVEVAEDLDKYKAREQLEFGWNLHLSRLNTYDD